MHVLAWQFGRVLDLWGGSASVSCVFHVDPVVVDE